MQWVCHDLCPETKNPKKTTTTADLGFWHPDPALPKKENKECFLSLIFYTAEMHHQESFFPLSFNKARTSCYTSELKVTDLLIQLIWNPKKGTYNFRQSTTQQSIQHSHKKETISLFKIPHRSRGNDTHHYDAALSCLAMMVQRRRPVSAVATDKLICGSWCSAGGWQLVLSVDGWELLPAGSVPKLRCSAAEGIILLGVAAVCCEGHVF